jgi:hypothetical protein
MQAAKTAFSRPLLFWGIPVVVGHLLVVLWHLFLLVKVEPNTALIPASAFGPNQCNSCGGAVRISARIFQRGCNHGRGPSGSCPRHRRLFAFS